MGTFDIFSDSDAQNAAQAQIAGLNSAYSQLVPLLQQGTGVINQYYGAGQGQLQNNANAAGGALNTNYAAALAPFTSNYNAGAAGQTQLGNLLGLNGANGSATAQNTLNNLPGYQFALNQGAQNVMRNQAATGQLNSGATNLDLQAQGQGLASQNYNNYVSQLQPYLTASNNAAGGIAGVNTGLGNALATNYNTLGANLNANLTGAGNAINANLNTQGAAAYGTQAGIGNAQANADYANLAQSGAIFGALTGAAGTALKISDERMKEDIEAVGELFDGQPVFRYRYKGSPRHEIGLIAQKVEEREPAAVVELSSRIKAVNYKRATDMASELGKFMKAA